MAEGGQPGPADREGTPTTTNSTWSAATDAYELVTF